MLLSAVIHAGQPLPSFRLQDIGNRWKIFEDVRGEKLTVIDFWATWCAPCARAMPELNKLFEQYSGKGVSFIGLNIDSPRNSSKVLPFAKAHKIKYHVLLDPNSEFASRLNIVSIPTLLIVNADKEIVYRHQGFQPGDEIEIARQIETYLKAENK